MSWTGYWLPNLTTWIGGGLVTLLLTTVGGFIVRWWVRRFLGDWLEQIFGEQQQTRELAKTAATQATRAVEHSGAATEQARTAADNSMQANNAIVWLAEQTATRDAVIEELRERVDRLLGTRARALATEQTGTLLVPSHAGANEEPLTVTGRHRLHTSLIDTAPYSDPDPDSQEPW